MSFANTLDKIGCHKLHIPISSGTRLFNMMNARIIQVNELNEGDKINEALIKNIVGKNELAAKGIKFMPRHLLFFDTNHFPSFPASDTAMSRRLICVKFEVTFTDLNIGEHPSSLRQQRDSGLKEELERRKARVIINNKNNPHIFTTQLTHCLYDLTGRVSRLLSPRCQNVL